VSQDQIEKRFRFDVRILIGHDGRHILAKFRGARGGFLMHAVRKPKKDKPTVVNGTSRFFSGRLSGGKGG